MNDQIFTGCIPALMTPCNADRQPDFDALVAKGRELIETGMSGVVYCGSMGDWPLLSEAQRQEGVERLVKAGIPTIVGTGAVNSKEAISHADHAARVGAQGLMVIPRVLSRGTSVAAQKPISRQYYKLHPTCLRLFTTAPITVLPPAPIYSSHYVTSTLT